MGISIDEKRVYDASEGPTPVYVVGEFGVARVDTSDDLVGEFGLAHECSARDAAGRDGRVAVATDEDVLVGVADGENGKNVEDADATDADATEADDEGDARFEALGVGPAVAVGYADADHLVVAREDGTVVQGDGENWTELGELADVRAIDGDFVAAASGVYHATGVAESATGTASGSPSSAGLQHVGLEDVRDVSATGTPLAATGDGLYRLGNGWMDELDGAFRAVSAAPAPASAGASAGANAGGDAGAGADGAVNSTTEAGASADVGALGWAHAAGEVEGEPGLFAHEDGEWRDVELPVAGDVVAIDHGRSEDESTSRGAYAVTDDGTVLLSVGDGWNHQILGLRGVRAIAAP